MGDTPEFPDETERIEQDGAALAESPPSKGETALLWKSRAPLRPLQWQIKIFMKTL